MWNSLIFCVIVHTQRSLKWAEPKSRCCMYFFHSNKMKTQSAFTNLLQNTNNSIRNNNNDNISGRKKSLGHNGWARKFQILPEQWTWIRSIDITLLLFRICVKLTTQAWIRMMFFSFTNSGFVYYIYILHTISSFLIHWNGYCVFVYKHTHSNT